MKKTKIAFVVYYLGYGGAEMALYYLVKLMDRERFDITVFTVYAGGEMEKEFRNLGVKVKSPYSSGGSFPGSTRRSRREAATGPRCNARR